MGPYILEFSRNVVLLMDWTTRFSYTLEICHVGASFRVDGKAQKGRNKNLSRMTKPFCPTFASTGLK